LHFQVVQGDANQEAVAGIRMELDAYDAAEKAVVLRQHEDAAQAEAQAMRVDSVEGNEEDEEEEQDDPEPEDTDFEGTNCVSLGSPIRRWMTANDVEAHWSPTRPIFKDFEHRLRLYFRTYFPDENLRNEAIRVSDLLKHVMILH
jgi:hypothetical protein